MTALVGRQVKATVSTVFNMMAMVALAQPDEPERKQAAQFSPAFGGGHLVGWQRIGDFHGGPPSAVIPSQVLTRSGNRLTDSTLGSICCMEHKMNI
jgi:hypothetical protein